MKDRSGNSPPGSGCGQTPALSIRNLHKSYGNVEALRDVSFEIHPGEFFGLLGPNGAGKTTLINIVTGLARRSSGDVSVFGHDVVQDYRTTRRMIGAVPQELVYDHFFSVRRTLVIHAGYFGVLNPGPRVEELLDRLELRPHENKTVMQLSGGMKRRLLIAKALVHRPPMLILDEPTAGVDINFRLSLWELLRETNAQGTTILLTTHYIDEAEELCERIGIINHGKFVALDRTQNLVRRLNEKKVTLVPQQPITALPASLTDLNATLEDGGRRIILHINHNTADLNDILRRMADTGVPLIDFRVEEADLEDVFIHLTAGRGSEKSATGKRAGKQPATPLQPDRA
ncbi:MAG: ABC transporter ATP-binding protein [Acidobacteria bacterium]|nr:ABC transporter ATP-binding protein [Acidobacteriota bacterium]